MLLIGEFSALVASFSFVSSSNLYSCAVQKCSPHLLNFLVGVISLFIMLIVLVFFSEFQLFSESFNDNLLLIVSGIIGIGIGDSFFYKSLDLLGARQTVLLEILSPVITGIISFFYYGTTISLIAWIGMLITGYGVYLVVNDQKEEQKEITDQNDIETATELTTFSAFNLDCEESYQRTKIPMLNSVKQPANNQYSRKQIMGLIYDIGYHICTALGVILSHDASQSGKFTSLQTSFLRKISGVLCVALIMVFSKISFKWPCESKKQTYLFLAGIIIGPFIGTWAIQTSLLYTRPEISQTIMAISPLFGLIISWARGEQMKLKCIIGSVISIMGVFIIIWF